MRFAALVLRTAFCCVTPMVAAQPAAPAEINGGATIPQSNEASLLSSQAQQALQMGDYRLALELIDRVGRLEDGLVPAPGARTCYPPWRERMRVLRMLPPDALEHFRAKYDAEVGGRFGRARERNDLPALRALFEEFPAASDWQKIGAELAYRLLDRGEYAASAEVLHVLVQENATPELLAQQVIGLAGMGAASSARVVQERLGAMVAGAGEAWQRRLGDLGVWVQSRQESLEPPQIGLALDADANWSLALAGGRGDTDSAGIGDARLADAVEQYRRLPTLSPAQDGGLLFLRARGQIWALNADSLTLRWSVSERRALQPVHAGGYQIPSAGRGPASEAELLLTHPLRHALVAGAGCIFTVESLTLFSGSEPETGWQSAYWGVSPNVLVARKQSNGEVLWELGADPRAELSNVAFQDTPVLAAGRLCIPAQRGDDLILVQVDPQNGKVLTTVPVVGPPTYFPPWGGRSLVVADDSTVYVATGNGVVAAFGARDLDWKWAAPYDSVLASMRGRRWWNRAPENPPDMGFDRPVLAENLLVVAPADSESILAFDRFDGRQRWPGLNRAPYQSVLGIGSAGLVLAGNGLTCIDARDGQSVVWRSAPLELVGRPVLQSDWIYAPVREGLAVVNARTGMLGEDPLGKSWRFGDGAGVATGRRESLDAGRVVGAALCVASDAVYAFSPNVVTKLADPARLAPDVRAGAQPTPEQRLGCAWRAYLEKRPEEALHWLEGVERGGAELSSAGEQLLVHTFVGLAQRASDSGERLDWLRRAEKLALSDVAAGRLSLLVGRALEDTADYAAAREHYTTLLMSARNVLVPSSTDGGLDVAVWMAAAERLRRLWSASEPQEQRAALEAALAPGNPRDLAALTRWEWMLRNSGDEFSSTHVAVEIATGPFPGELTHDRLPHAEVLSALKENPSRMVQVEHWASATARGDLDAARTESDRCAAWMPAVLRDAERRGEGLAGSLWSEGGLPGRAQAVARDFAKLQQDPTRPFDLSGGVLRWKRSACDLMLDHENGLWPGPFVPLLNREQRRIELVNVHSGETWRAHPARLASQGPEIRLEEALRALQTPEAESAERSRELLRLVRSGGRAVSAVPGGLVAFGLWGYGAEHRAGAKFWEAPIPLAHSSSADGSDQIAVGPLGCYVRSQDGRLMMLGWADGKPRWSRDIGRHDVNGVHVSEDKLFVTLNDGHATVYSAESGSALRDWQERLRGLQQLKVLGPNVLAFSDDEVRAYAARDGRLLWSQNYQELGWFETGTDGSLLAINDQGGGGWRLFEVATGREIALPGFGVSDGVAVIAREGGRIIIAESGAQADVSFALIQVFDEQKRALLWSQRVPAAAIPNATQLIGNPECIVLLVSPANEEGNEGSLEKLSLQLIEKSSGALAAAVPIGAAFGPPTGVAAEPVVLVTPTRILVQANDAVAAWGRPSWGETP